MPLHRSIFTAAVVASLLVTAATPACAILVRFVSLDRISFAISDVSVNRQRVDNALRLKECQFAQGTWINGNLTLNYRGQTAPLSEMIRQLAECHDLPVQVSFKKLDERYDWQITRHGRDKLIDVIVNLNSQNIALEELMIPPTAAANVDPSSR